MKKISFLFLFAMVCVSNVLAQPDFVIGRKYSIRCAYFGSGSIALGVYHNAQPLLYYIPGENIPDDGYWYIDKGDDGYYTFRNALSMQYLIYDSERVETQKKGLNLSSSAQSTQAKWNIQELERGGYFIQSVASPDQYFNLRTDGSYLVGTYANYNSDNGIFCFVDKDGNVLDGGSDTPSTEDPEPEADDCGVTADGYYWETTGKLQLPIVASTASDPILYKIKNARTGKYLVNTDDKLYQTTGEGDNFYFRKNGEGYSIFTEDGRFVMTNYPTNNEPLALKKSSSVTGTNYWAFAFYDDYYYPGYTVEKLTQRPIYSDSYWWWEEPVITNNQSEFVHWGDYNKNYIRLYKQDDPGATFVFYSADARHAKHIMENGVIIPGVELMGFRTFIDTLRINDKELFYDQTDGMYVTTASAEAHLTGTFRPRVHFVSKVSDADYEMRIDGVAPDAEGVVVLEDFDCSVPHTLNLYKNGEEIESAPIRFTYLNIVEVTHPSCNGYYYTPGSIRVTQANVAGYDSIYTAAFKYRGATAQGFDKKSYAVKLYEADGVTSKDVEFLGLRDDNNWILDAMAVDKACMRNRVSTDLWNDFAIAPYHKAAGYEKKARHGTRGEFAEVYLNGKYHGIYCMTEKMDRKQLKLRKLDEATETSKPVIRGTLYKSSQWGYEVLMGHETDVDVYPKTPPRSYNNNDYSETWANFEIKYPDWEEEPIDWAPLWNAINFVATTNDVTFGADFHKYFDQANITDYYLFIELMLATDNHGKNMFFYNYDQLCEDIALREKIGVAPWDLDGAWGRRWDGSKDLCKPKQDFNTFLWKYEHGNLTLFHRMKRNSKLGWNAELRARYAELRDSHFSEDALCKRFQDYADLFTACGADAREEKRWNKYHSDINADVAYIKNWVAQRLEYLDKQYDYVKPDGITHVERNHLTVQGGNNCILITAEAPQTVSIYALNGQLVRRVCVTEGITEINGVASGIYIVNTSKIIVH